MRSTIVDRTESPRFAARRDAFAEAFPTPDWEPAWSALVQELDAERDGGRALRATSQPSPEFVAEAANHLDTLEVNTRAGLLAAQMLAPQRPRFNSVRIERHAWA